VPECEEPVYISEVRDRSAVRLFPFVFFFARP
jgi:hypothetical protein